MSVNVGDSFLIKGKKYEFMFAFLNEEIIGKRIMDGIPQNVFHTPFIVTVIHEYEFELRDKLGKLVKVVISKNGNLFIFSTFAHKLEPNDYEAYTSQKL